MAKFFGEIGYGQTEETSPGIFRDIIIEKSYYGDVVRNARNSVTAEQLNNNFTVDNSISIVSDAYANEHYFAIRYIKWQGALWTIYKVTVAPPRLILMLGGVYNGPTPDSNNS